MVGVPGIGGVAVVGAEIRPVHVLERGDVVHHEGLGVAPLLVVDVLRVRPDVGAVGHHRVFHRVGVEGQRPEAPGLVAVLQPERVADLVDDGVVVVVALHRVDARAAEPDVAGGDMVVGIIGIGGAGVGVVAEPQGGVAGAPVEVADAEVGEALDRVPLIAELVGELRIAERQVHRRQLVGAQLVEPVQHIGRIVRLVVGDAVGIAVVDGAGVPLLSRDQAVDELEAGGADRGDGEAGDADLGGEGCFRIGCDGHENCSIGNVLRVKATGPGVGSVREFRGRNRRRDRKSAPTGRGLPWSSVLWSAATRDPTGPHP